MSCIEIFEFLHYFIERNHMRRKSSADKDMKNKSDKDETNQVDSGNDGSEKDDGNIASRIGGRAIDNEKKKTQKQKDLAEKLLSSQQEAAEKEAAKNNDAAEAAKLQKAILTAERKVAAKQRKSQGQKKRRQDTRNVPLVVAKDVIQSDDEEVTPIVQTRVRTSIDPTMKQIISQLKGLTEAVQSMKEKEAAPSGVSHTRAGTVRNSTMKSSATTSTNNDGTDDEVEEESDVPDSSEVTRPGSKKQDALKVKSKRSTSTGNRQQSPEKELVLRNRGRVNDEDGNLENRFRSNEHPYEYEGRNVFNRMVPSSVPDAYVTQIAQAVANQIRTSLLDQLNSPLPAAPLYSGPSHFPLTPGYHPHMYQRPLHHVSHFPSPPPPYELGYESVAYSYKPPGSPDYVYDRRR